MTPVDIYEGTRRSNFRCTIFHLVPLMKTLTKRRRNVVDLKKRARRVLTASINLVQERWGKLDMRKHSTTSIHVSKSDPD